MSATRILVADDDEGMRWSVARALRRKGFEVVDVDNGDAAVEAYLARAFDVCVFDLVMPGKDGIEALSAVRAFDPEALVVLMTGHGTIQTAVEAMRRGAFDYVTKPFEVDELELAIERALGHLALLRENRSLRYLIEERSAFGGLVGQSPAMQEVYRTIELLEGSDATVLVQGESGTGKELVARAIHLHSPARKGGPFVALNCAALAEGLFESELFGHEPGAFTGAVQRKHGMLEQADGGTLFFDEIGELSVTSQAKLERFLQERSFTPIGSSELREVDVRIVAATNRDLEEMVEAGGFRQELYWRINVIPLRLPPLRERREDVAPLVAHALARCAERLGRPAPSVGVEAMIALTSYNWPGNVRELVHVCERLVVLAGDPSAETAGEDGIEQLSGRRIDVDDLPSEILGGRRSEARVAPTSLGYQDAVLAFEREYFEALFVQESGNVSQVARVAGLSRGHLHRKVKQLGLDPDRFRGGAGSGESDPPGSPD